MAEKETKTFRLNLGYKVDKDSDITEEVKGEDGQMKIVKRPPTQEEIDDNKADITIEYINYAMTAGHPKGLSSQFRRLYANIQNKLQEARESKTYVAELLPSEIKFIVDTFKDDEVKFTPKLAMYVVVLEDELYSL